MSRTPPQSNRNPTGSELGRSFLRPAVWESILLVGAVLCLLFSLGVAVTASPTTDELALLYLAFASYSILLITVAAIYARWYGWLHPLCFIALWLFFTTVIPRIGVVVAGMQWHEALTDHSPAALNKIAAFHLLLETIGFLVLVVGYQVPLLKRVPVVHWPRQNPPLWRLACIVALSLLGFYLFVVNVGGLDQLLLQRGLPRHLRAVAEIGGHWVLVVNATSIALLIHYSTNRRSVRPTIALTLGLIGAAFLTFAVTGSRSAVLMPFIVLGALWAVRSQRLPRFSIAVMALVSLLSLGGLADLRRATHGARSAGDIEINIDLREWLFGGWYSMEARGAGVSSAYAILARVPGEEPFRFGETYLAFATGLVPRAVWPDKPMQSGRLAGAVFFGASKGVPTGTVGEAYWNFHIPGVIAIFLLWGMFLRLAARIYATNVLHGHHLTLPYLITLVYFAPFGTAYFNWLLTFVPALLLLIWLCGLPGIAWHVVGRNQSDGISGVRRRQARTAAVATF